MAALAATRAGAGYVTALRPRASCSRSSRSRLLEVDDARAAGRGRRAHTPGGVERGRWSATGRAGAVVLGPGLGRSDGASAFARELSPRASTSPLVIDADGLNALAGRPRRRSRSGAAPTVLTPHAGELGRLLGIDSERGRAPSACATRATRGRRAQARRRAQGRRHARRRARRARGGQPRRRARRSPPPGTGDVLSGVIGALLATGLAPVHAACAGVHAHLRGGRRRRRASPPAPDGVIASDVIEALPAAVAAEPPGRLARPWPPPSPTSWTLDPSPSPPEDAVETVVRALRDARAPGRPGGQRGRALRRDHHRGTTS